MKKYDSGSLHFVVVLDYYSWLSRARGLVEGFSKFSDGSSSLINLSLSQMTPDCLLFTSTFCFDIRLVRVTANEGLIWSRILHTILSFRDTFETIFWSLAPGSSYSDSYYFPKLRWGSDWQLNLLFQSFKQGFNSTRCSSQMLHIGYFFIYMFDTPMAVSLQISNTRTLKRKNIRIIKAADGH